MTNNFNIKFVDFDYDKDVNFFHFYPDRKFDAETIVFLYRKESFGNSQYLNYFYECDKRNIKVNLFCSNNFFPLASLVSHSCYTEKPHTNDEPKRLNFLLPNSHLSRYSCDVTQLTKHRKDLGIEHLLPIKYEKKAFLSEEVAHPICQCAPACTTARNHEKKVLKDHKIKDLDRVRELYEYLKDKPIYMSKQFLEYFGRIEKDFASEKICAEWKCVASPRAMELLRSFDNDKIINIDKKFSWDIVNKYKLDQTYLSFQFLMSIHKSWRYIALGGSSNVMQAFYPINTLLFGDNHGHGDCPNMALLKIKLNKYFYGEEPIGLRTDFKEVDKKFTDKHIKSNDLNDIQIDIVKNKILCYL